MSTSLAPSLPNFCPGENTTDEFTQILHSLPFERGWNTTFLHLYEGHWYTTMNMKGLVAVQSHFQAFDSDILLVTSPKCGTTWLQSILYALINRSLYLEPDDKEKHPLLNKHPHELVPFLELGLYLKDPNPDLSSFTSPRVFASHIARASLPKSVTSNSKCKLVYMCRNPKDAFISLWHFLNKLRPGEMGILPLEDAFDMFCRGVSGYGPYWNHVLDYYKASIEMPQRVLFLKYEDMKEEPHEQLKRLAKFIGYPFSEEELINGGIDEIVRLCSFDNMSRLDVNKDGKTLLGIEKKNFFRRGQVGDWLNYLTPYMIGRIDCITKEKFGEIGLYI